MSTETIGEGLTSEQLSDVLSRGDYKPIKRTKKQQRDYDKWLAQIAAEREAERQEDVNNATRTALGRFVHWLFQTWQWKEYKKR